MSNAKQLADALRFTKKPVTIEAIQWDGTESGIQRIKAKFTDLETCAKSGHLRKDVVTHWSIRTLEGSHVVSPGDWVIKGVKGEYYPCKPDIFAMTYTPDLAAYEATKAEAQPGWCKGCTPESCPGCGEAAMPVPMLDVQPVPAGLLDSEIAPRPLSYPLHDYHRAMSEGPLHATWQDKPHRLVYDLIAAVRFYAAATKETTNG